MDDLSWLIARQIPHLRRFAFALTGNRATADDIVQDCLEKAVRKRDQWKSQGSLKSWLFRICHRAHLDHVRRDRLRLAPATRNDEDDDEIYDQQWEPADQHNAAICREVAVAVRALPAAQRDCLLLVALEGFSYDEAAAILGIPIGTVRSRLSRARQALMDHRPDWETLAAEQPAEPRLRRIK